MSSRRRQGVSRLRQVSPTDHGSPSTRKSSPTREDRHPAFGRSAPRRGPQPCHGSRGSACAGDAASARRAGAGHRPRAATGRRFRSPGTAREAERCGPFRSGATVTDAGLRTPPGKNRCSRNRTGGQEINMIGRPRPYAASGRMRNRSRYPSRRFSPDPGIGCRPAPPSGHGAPAEPSQAANFMAIRSASARQRARSRNR